MEKSITIASKIENLRQIEQFVDEIAVEFQLNSEKYGNILIAALEAANNGIVHGNKLNDKELLTLTARKDATGLYITVVDNGKGFDFNSIPDPTIPENIEKLNGRGVFLMQKLSDEIKFFNNGNTVELKFNL